MDLIKIIDFESNPARFTESFISVDRKTLVLSYLIDDQDQETGYNDFFDRLDREEGTYLKLNELIFETDFIHSIPSNILKFQNLIHLTVRGSRFWNLNMKQVPLSVKKLTLIDHSNLSPQCIEGIERLTDLTEVQLDVKAFNFSDIFYGSNSRITSHQMENEQIIEFPCLPELKKISFHTGISYQREDLNQGWKKIFKNNHIFNQIRDRIVKINLDQTDVFPIIEVTLR